MGYQTHYVDINLIMAIWRNSYSLARIFNKRSCFLWTCLARLLVQKSSVQKKRPCLSTNQIEKVCWLVFSGQRKKYVQQTNTYRKDTRLIWIYLIWIFLNFFIYHKAFTGFNILFRKCQVGSEYSIWWKIISTYLVHLLTYLFQIQAHNFVRSWIWKIPQPVFLIPTPVPEQIKSSFMGQPTSQPARVWFRQNIRHSQKIYNFWKLFIYRFIIAIQNGPSWVLPISDFFKLLFNKLRNEEK